jgi:hypothetical protein
MVNVSAKLPNGANKVHLLDPNYPNFILIVLVRTAWLIKPLRALLWAPPGTSKHLVASRRSTCQWPLM